jgi:DNA-binding NtrC family response regulator
MCERLGRRYGRPGRVLSEEARMAVVGHDWPGNVRELVNAVQRAVMLSDGPEIEAEDLGLTEMTTEMLTSTLATPSHDRTAFLPDVSGHSGSAASGLSFDFEHGLHKAADVEKELIMQALRFTRGNVSRAAKLIGMQRSSIRYRIDRYGLERFVVEVANR